MTIRILGAPRQYIQGPGAIGRLSAVVAELGRCPLLVADPVALEREGTPLDGVAVARFGGEITHAEIERLAREGQEVGADLVVAMGGGKAIDAGKGVARTLALPIVVVPTVASNDAPTSRLIVIYDASHRIVEVQRLAANPDVVLVDTAIIARAPRRLLAAGIGDALSKKFEAAACAAAGGRNFFDASPPIAALALSETCYATIRRDALAALEAADRGEPDAALENVVEAAILHSGLGFESGGLSLAHSLTRGLTSHPKLAHALHGELVAYGTLVQVAHERLPQRDIAELAAFCRACGLPTRLRDFGVADPSEADFSTIVAPTLAAPYASHLALPLSEASLTAALRQVEDLA